MMSTVNNSLVEPSSSTSTAADPRKPLAGHVSPKNFHNFNWKELHNVRIEDCEDLVSPRHPRLCKSTLTILQFAGVTSFLNLKLLLSVCDRIQTLSFYRVILCDYVLPSPDEPKQGEAEIELPRLRFLKFFGCGSLSVHELHILKFLREEVAIGDLYTVAIRSYRGPSYHVNDCCSQRTSSSNNNNNNDNNMFDDTLQPTILAEFLNKNWSTLKNLLVDRTKVILYDPATDKCPKMVNIQLEKLECDVSAPGFDAVLESQSELKTLYCFNKLLIYKNQDEIWNALRRCSDTLETIIVQNNVKRRPEDKDEFENITMLTHDCKAYKYCRTLTELDICITRIHDPPYPESFQIRPGALVNAQLIPSHLKYLTIRFDYISEYELKTFANGAISYFFNLKQFIFQGNTDYVYRLKIPWILTLVDLPKLRYFRFVGCRIEDIIAFRQITKSLTELGRRLTVTRETCIYINDKGKSRSPSRKEQPGSTIPDKSIPPPNFRIQNVEMDKSRSSSNRR